MYDINNSVQQIWLVVKVKVPAACGEGRTCCMHLPMQGLHPQKSHCFCQCPFHIHEEVDLDSTPTIAGFSCVAFFVGGGGLLFVPSCLHSQLKACGSDSDFHVSRVLVHCGMKKLHKYRLYFYAYIDNRPRTI